MSKEIQASSYNNFIKSIRSEATKTIYVNWLKEFKKFMHASDYDGLLRIKKQKQL